MCQGHNKLVIVNIELWKKKKVRSDKEILTIVNMYVITNLNSAVWDGVIYPQEEKVHKINQNKVNPTSQLESISSLIL